MPPPIKTPPEPKRALLNAEMLTLFFQNLEEMRRYYRSRDAGVEVGHNVLCELILSNVSLALELALQGKRWEQGNNR